MGPKGPICLSRNGLTTFSALVSLHPVNGSTPVVSSCPRSESHYQIHYAGTVAGAYSGTRAMKFVTPSSMVFTWSWVYSLYWLCAAAFRSASQAVTDL